MSQLETAWLQQLERLAQLETPPEAEVEQWQAFLEERQEILLSLETLKDSGANPTSNLIPTETRELIYRQCDAVQNGITALEGQRGQISQAIQSTASSKHRLQARVLKDSPYVGGFRATA